MNRDPNHSHLGRALSNLGPAPAGMVRRDHPAEALEAAAKIGASISRMHARVIEALRNGPLTALELEPATGMVGSSVRPRLVELTGCAAAYPGLVVEPLVRRLDATRLTARGRKAGLYELTDAGRAALLAMDTAGR